MIKKVEGIIVKETPYKETSKILTVFTKEYGMIGIISRGCKKIKSPLNAVSNKLIYGMFHINYKKELSTLVEVDVIDTLSKIRKDITRISYASFLTDLATQVYKHENNKDIYDLYISSILKINEGYDPMVITNILELKLLDFLGIRPIIDKCAICESTNNIVTISSYKGGYLCSHCVSNEKIYNTKTIKLIRMFYYVDINKISKTNISINIKKEINEFINDYYDRYTGLYLKSKSFLKNLEKIN